MPTWDTWCSTTTASSTSTTSTWGYWCDTNSTASCTTTGTVWTHWIVSSGTNATTSLSVPYVAPAETDEQRQAREARHAIAVETERKRLAERQAANARAEKLLTENLHPRQLRQFRRFGSFIVYGQNNTRYRIRKGRVANVDVVDPNGVVPHRLCFHPGDHEMPDYDVMLAQKLWLEHDEEAIHRIANRHASITGSQRVLAPLH